MRSAIAIGAGLAALGYLATVDWRIAAAVFVMMWADNLSKGSSGE